MNIRRIIFLLIFGLYQVTVFGFTIYIESKKDDLKFLFDMFGEISLFKWGALLGVILIVIEFLWSRSDAKKAANHSY